jgi:hypothetical protein
LNKILNYRTMRVQAGPKVTSRYLPDVVGKLRGQWAIETQTCPDSGYLFRGSLIAGQNGGRVRRDSARQKKHQRYQPEETGNG